MIKVKIKEQSYKNVKLFTEQTFFNHYYIKDENNIIAPIDTRVLEDYIYLINIVTSDVFYHSKDFNEIKEVLADNGYKPCNVDITVTEI